MTIYSFIGQLVNGVKDFHGTDLSRIDLSYLHLEGLNFKGANLSGCTFQFTGLISCNFENADLSDVNMRRTVLENVNLTNANLDNTSFNECNFEDIEIDTNTINKYFPSVCPSEGEFIGWKKACIWVNENEYYPAIVKLLISSDAKRGSAFGRKCRCNKARVLSIETLDGVHTDVAFSSYDRTFKYELGKEVSVDNFDEDRSHECAPGIHFFMTREEAVNY